jgi:hypothetical protein
MTILYSYFVPGIRKIFAQGNPAVYERVTLTRKSQPTG